MEDEKNTMQCNHMCKHKCKSHHGTCGGVYGLAFLGALVYYIQGATSFWAGVVGVAKALFWPAVLIHKLFGLLKM